MKAAGPRSRALFSVVLVFAFAPVLGAAPRTRVYESARAGVRFEVPEGSQVFERTLFDDSRAPAGERLVTIRIVPKGMSEQASLGGRAQVQIEVRQSSTDGSSACVTAASAGRVIASETVRVGGRSAVRRTVKTRHGTRRQVDLASQRRHYHVVSGTGSADAAVFDTVLAAFSLVTTPGAVADEQPPPPPPPPLPTPSVRVVYLVPTGRTASEGYTKALEKAMREVQLFYRQQLANGHTFTLADPIVEVLPTGHSESWYQTDAPASTDEGRFWESVLADGFRLTGASVDDPQHRWVFVIDADPLCNQYTGGTSGLAVLAANDLRGELCQQNKPVCEGAAAETGGVCRWVGGLAHELGHAFGLEHPLAGTCPVPDPGCANAIMWTGWLQFPDAYLLVSERQQLETTLASFFTPVEPAVTTYGCSGGCPPAPPTELAAMGSGKAVWLNWLPSTGATSYDVMRSTTPGSGYSKVATVSATAYLDKDVVEGTSYYYVVTSVSGAGVGPNSVERPASPEGSSSLVARYRLYSDITKEHHFTTDANEYAVLGTRGWSQEGIAYHVLATAAPQSRVVPAPLYRAYHAGIQQHLWTVDVNEYDFLGRNGWQQEGIDGYLLPVPLGGTVPLYRLAYAYLPLHLYTTDEYEYSVLSSRGWVQEGVVGYVIP